MPPILPLAPPTGCKAEGLGGEGWSSLQPLTPHGVTSACLLGGEGKFGQATADLSSQSASVGIEAASLRVNLPCWHADYRPSAARGPAEQPANTGLTVPSCTHPVPSDRQAAKHHIFARIGGRHGSGGDKFCSIVDDLLQPDDVLSDSWRVGGSGEHQPGLVDAHNCLALQVQR